MTGHAMRIWRSGGLAGAFGVVCQTYWFLRQIETYGPLDYLPPQATLDQGPVDLISSPHSKPHRQNRLMERIARRA